MRASRRAPLIATFLVAAVALVASGCGSASKTSSSSSSSATASTPAATVATTPAPPPAHVSIASPRSGSHTSQTVIVRLTVSGGGSVAKQFNYLLDGRRVRVSSTRVTFHHVTPGHHRLEVVLVAAPGVRATTSFTVRAPKVVVSTAPVLTTPTTPTTSTPTPTPTQTTTHQQTTPKPKPTPTPTPKPSGGIPQGGAGDGDADNSGGASDGDGNL